MDTEFINLDSGNIASAHLCCIIRTQKAHPGVEAKRAWLAARLDEGHVFRKVNAKGCSFIEYAPLETAWAPVVGDNYLYIYCLWVLGDLKGHGYGRQLMEYCIADAKARGKSGAEIRLHVRRSHGRRLSAAGAEPGWQRAALCGKCKKSAHRRAGADRLL